MFFLFVFHEVFGNGIFIFVDQIANTDLPYERPNGYLRAGMKGSDR